MRTVLVIGIGAGNPEHMTVQAIGALNRADVVFVVDKGGRAPQLVALRHEIMKRFVAPGREPRLVTIPDPPRDRTAPAYADAVDSWRSARARSWGEAIAAELAQDECGAFLVWGDPALYDSTIAVLDEVREAGAATFAVEVIPGITAPQALAAAHGVAWNRVGGSVAITTGRRLAADGLPEGADDVIVMLDSDCAFAGLDEEELHVYWGAYIATGEEILAEGAVAEVADSIRERRSSARERLGWVMDTYLLRRSSGTARSSAPARSRSGE